MDNALILFSMASHFPKFSQEEGVYYESITLRDNVWVKSETLDPANGQGEAKTIVTVDKVQNGGIIALTIQNSRQNGNSSGGMDCNGNDNPVIANCVIRDNRHGIMVSGNAAPLIVNNVITDNSGNGIQTKGNGPATIYDNIIVNNRGEAISCNGQPTLDITDNNI